jgi:L-threonylcarbamoyladenylate synthase
MRDFEKDIIECLRVLKEGGLILYPTDTVWGIGCDATNADAVAKVFALKQRPDEKALIVLVAGEKDILEYTAAPDLALFDHLQTVDRPTTVIYDGAIGFAENLVAADGSIAIRICRDPFCRQLIKRFRKPVVSTSANISGAISPSNFYNISNEIKKGVDYIVQYRQEDTSPAHPSSIIKWHNGRIEVIR